MTCSNKITPYNKIAVYILIPFIACFMLFILEQVLLVDYFTKTSAKLILFAGIPLLVWYLYKPLGNKPLDNSKEINIKLSTRLLPGLYIGISVIGIVVLAYLLFRNSLDSVSIMAELNEKSKITKQSYFYTGLYITLGNSFLEESFFRNYIFLNLYRSNFKRLAYIASALLFSVYHLAIFNTWFSPLILLLALCGLTIAGLLLNYIVIKTNSMLSSWIIHICANIAIIGIGYTWLI